MRQSLADNEQLTFLEAESLLDEAERLESMLLSQGYVHHPHSPSRVPAMRDP